MGTEQLLMQKNFSAESVAHSKCSVVLTLPAYGRHPTLAMFPPHTLIGTFMMEITALHQGQIVITGEVSQETVRTNT